MTNSDLSQLLEMMALLRDPIHGCPWSVAQTFSTIVPHTLEETYEVIDAIENKSPSEIRIELGDLLLQIIYYCQMGKEKGWFDFNDVVNTLCEKIKQRHPHVFAGEKTQAGELHNHWEMLKEKERQLVQQEAKVLSDVPSNLPALSRAQKLQNRAARVGFDWPHIRLVLEKVQEEIAEFEEAYFEKDNLAAKEELGDILFACANLARHLNSDAEAILRQANTKFEKRFNAVEKIVNHSGKDWHSFSLEELERFWQQVKKHDLTK